MSKILLIAGQSLRLLLKDKSALLWMLLLPTVYIFFFGNAFRKTNDPSKNKAYLGIYNQDNGFIARLLIDGIRSENIQVDSLKERPAAVSTRLLVIPADLTQNVLAGKKTVLALEKKQDSNIEAAMAAEMAIRKSYIRLLADLAELKVNDTEVTAENIRALENRPALITVSSSYAGKHKIIPSGYNQQVPANIVMFTMMILFIYAGQMVLEEKKSGIFRRIYIAPVSFSQVFFGKLLGGTCIGLLQIALLAIIGKFVFGIYYGPSLTALFLLALFFAATVAAMGLTLGMLIESEEKMTGLAIILSIAMAAISGCWWPLEISPPWMIKIASVLPSGAALAGFHQLISYGRGLEALPKTLGQLGITTLIFALLFGRLLVKLDKTKL